MTEFTIKQIASILNGKLFSKPDFQDHLISQFVTDSRTFFKKDSSAFFAITGPRNNGHTFIPGLIDRSISVFIVSDESVIFSEANFILVDDTTKALQQLAAFNRRQYHYPVVGITGSNGKTIVKEWLHNLLSDEFRIVRSPKSYNSQIGVPLSVLLMNSEYNLGIFEAGISMPGEMQNLSNIISPAFGIFTNIGDAHQENFKSVEQKTNEKLKLFEKSKKLIFCSDSETTTPLIDQFCKNHSIQKINWSFHANDANIRYSVEKMNGSSQITAKTEYGQFTFRIPFTDYSAIENSCHCFALSLVMSNDLPSVLPKFEKLESIAMRLEIKQGINNCLLVNDYYNSDLNSLAIALSVLHQQAAKKHLYKRIILSDILQTGMPRKHLYSRVNELLVEWGIDELTGIGPVISKYREQFTIKNKFYTSTDEFLKYFNREEFKSSAILIKGARAFTFEKVSGILQQKAHQTELEINLNALANNLNVYKGLLQPKTKVMVMVKAFSYGSGDIEIAKFLQFHNVDYLAVAIADEGIELRNAGISTPVIVMNPDKSSFQKMIDHELEPNIYNLKLLENFANTVSQYGLIGYPVHLKIDTGMNRLGFKEVKEVQNAVSFISSKNSLKVKSVFSHLAGSDEPELDEFTKSQISRFEEYSEIISDSLPYHFDRHILNSAGIERFPEKQYEMVRLGIGLYGVSVTGLPLKNIGTLKSTVSQIKKVDIHETVGYSRKGRVSSESLIAVVPLGYADGLDRKLGNRNGEAFVNGKRVPIVGNICMDMLMLDVTKAGVKQGDKVEFFGSEITVTEIAEKTHTIPYEILTGISNRVKRVYVQE